MRIEQLTFTRFLAALFFIKNKTTKNYDLAILAVILLIILSLKYSLGVSYHNGMLAVLFIPLIILISLNSGMISKICNWKPLVFLGEISYSIYILQCPMFLFAGKILYRFHIKDKTMIFYCFILMLIIGSAISYTYIETPLRKKINKLKLS
jgi:peptidoglycan/LPS O-acetylase OafA/YrhL